MLNKITENTKIKVARNKEYFPIPFLENSMYFQSKCVSLSHYITRADKSGIIAEFKRKSPSNGIINQYADILSTTIGYMQAGASALSILTEQDYFMGKNSDLTISRNANYCPILRKDFIIDEYQIVESKSIGADSILLIAACLTQEEIKRFYSLAKNLGMEVLIEIHDKSEIEKLPKGEYIIGVNNRNLKTMEVDLKNSIDVAKLLSNDFTLVSESGIKTVEDILILKKAGFKGFLIGELFMKSANPAGNLKQFIQQLRAKEYAN